MKTHRLRFAPVCVIAITVGGCGGRASSSPAQPAVAQPLSFVTTRGSDTVTVHYRAVAYTRRDEIDVVLREARAPVTGPFTGFFRGYSVALAPGDPEMPLRAQVESDRVDADKIRFTDQGLSDSIVFRIRHVTPDSLEGMWFVVQEWRLWHRDGNPLLQPVSVARSTDVFRPRAR